MGNLDLRYEDSEHGCWRSNMEWLAINRRRAGLKSRARHFVGGFHFGNWLTTKKYVTGHLLNSGLDTAAQRNVVIRSISRPTYKHFNETVRGRVSNDILYHYN